MLIPAGIRPLVDKAYCDDSKKHVNAVIEVPKGGRVKYAICEYGGMLRVESILSASSVYPHNYGYIPHTKCEDDNRRMGIIVIMQEPLVPGCILRTRPIGILYMTENGKEHNHIVAVAVDDQEYASVKELDQLPPHRIVEIETFFRDYKKKDTEKIVTVDGWGDAKTAGAYIEKANKDVDEPSHLKPSKETSLLKQKIPYGMHAPFGCQTYPFMDVNDTTSI